MNFIYEVFIWLFIIFLIVIVITWIIFTHLRSFALFQATHDEKWYPEQEKCKEDDPPDCREYSDKFTDGYLIIGDKNHKCFTKQEIINISNSRTWNLGDLHFINIWKFENFADKPVVLYYHGNNDNISYRKYVIDICYSLQLNLVLVDYRGYGDSGNYPDSKFLLKDAQTAFLHVATEYHHSRIIIWGESLGGIAAIWTAHKYKCAYLVLLSTFADLKTVINKMEAPKALKNALKNLVQTKLMNNGKWIKNVDSPTVIMHSPDDDILPYINAEMLFESVGTNHKKLINIAGPHSHPYLTKENLRDLLEFINIDSYIRNDDKKLDELLDIINNI